MSHAVFEIDEHHAEFNGQLSGDGDAQLGAQAADHAHGGVFFSHG